MAKRIEAERALVLAPHTDDGELGCGGTIARMLEEGVDVYYVAFSTCRRSLPEGCPPDTLEREVRAATLQLGMRPERVILFDFDVREFDRARQAILDEMVRLKRELDPDLVFLPCPQDMHQDHVVVATEGIRAFKRCTILAYELPWNNITFSTQCFVALEERHVAQKVEAIGCYASQQNRPYADPGFIRGLARTRGVESGYYYAEAFQAIRWMIGCAALPLGESGSAFEPRREEVRRRRTTPALVNTESGIEVVS